MKDKHGMQLSGEWGRLMKVVLHCDKFSREMGERTPYERGFQEGVRHFTEILKIHFPEHFEEYEAQLALFLHQKAVDAQHTEGQPCSQ